MNVRAAERIRALAGDPAVCWAWQGQKNNDGYGQMSVEGRPRLTHRLSYETFVGPIPAGLQLDHLCRNRACFNPAHLEPVTGSENVLRSPLHVSAVRRQMTTCARGHAFDREYVHNGQTRRHCSTCDRLRYEARRQAVAT